MKNSSYTGRAPRTLEQAFGTYQRQSKFVEPIDKQDKIVVIGCTVAALGLVIMVMIGWIV